MHIFLHLDVWGCVRCKYSLVLKGFHISMHLVHPELRRKKKAQLHPVHLDLRRTIISPVTRQNSW